MFCSGSEDDGLRIFAPVPRNLSFRSWREGEAEGGAKPVRLCPCNSDVNLFGYGEGIVHFNPEIPDGALDLRMTQRVGFVLRISFLIENQRPAAHRSVLAVATDCASP